MYTDKELLIFAEILQKFCGNHLCYECPFRQEPEVGLSYKCKINIPYNWEIKKENDY